MTFWKKKEGESDAPSTSQPQKGSAPSDKKVTSPLDSKPQTGSLSAPDSNSLNAQSSGAQNSPGEATRQSSPAQSGDLSSDPSLGKVRSALSAGTVIQGKLSFDTPVRIDGKLSGEVFSSKVLIIGETAQIQATLEAASLIIMGKVTGDIKATEKIQVCKGAVLEGAISAPAVVIESGAVFNGKCEMTSQAAGAKAAKDSAKTETKIYSDENLASVGKKEQRKNGESHPPTTP